jgi:hypothetical protein
MRSKGEQILVMKASGEMEVFESVKLLQSLTRAGADEHMAHQILKEIEPWLHDGVTTRKIYVKALAMLRQRMKVSAGRYRIKDALMELGNSGRPFEIFIGELFKKKGYDVETGIVVEGKSITHEMDVIATSGKEQHLVECKYSQMQGNYVSIQVPLYVHSRVNDIVAYRSEQDAYKHLVFFGWVATNTRFSPDSVKYASDYGLKLLSWNYPAGNSVRDLIEREHIFPITVLSSLADRDKEKLLAQNIVTCSQLLSSISVLSGIGLSPGKIKKVQDEIIAVHKK